MAGAPAGRALAEARLVGGSCEDIRATAKRQAEARIKRMIEEVDEQYRSWSQQQPDCWAMYREMAAEERALRAGRGYMFGDVIGDSSGAGGLGLSGFGSGGGGAGYGVAASPAVRMAKSASGTNNQVAGVDEADIVKNDGRYVYVAMNGALRIVEAMRPQVLSVTKLPGSAREMFVEGDRAVVYVSYGGSGRPPCTYGYDCQFAGDGSSTKVLVLDVADRAHPKIVRQIELSGSLMAARRIGRTVHTVVADGDFDTPDTRLAREPETCGTLEKYVRAKFKRLKEENTRKILASTYLPVIRDGGVEEKPLCENSFDAPCRRRGVHDRSLLRHEGRRSARRDGDVAEPSRRSVRVGERPLSPRPCITKGRRARLVLFYPSTNEVSDVHVPHGRTSGRYALRRERRRSRPCPEPVRDGRVLRLSPHRDDARESARPEGCERRVDPR
jgi:hypothetical protein